MPWASVEEKQAMVIRKNIIALLLCILWSSPLSAATLDEAMETCGNKKGNAKTCCTMLLDEPDEVAQCIRAITAKPAPATPSAPTRPVPAPAPREPRNRPASASEAAKTFQSNQTQSGSPTASYRVGAGMSDFPGRSALPAEQWQPWKMELNPYRIKSYGASTADAKKFEQKLLTIADIVKQVPVLNPAFGCSPRLAPFLSSAYNEGKPAAKHEPLHGYLLLGCFKLHDVERKKNGVAAKERVIGETRQSSIYVNSAGALIPGSDAGWYEVGTNGANPFDTLFEQPEIIGRHADFPVYDAIDRVKGRNKGHAMIVLGRTGVEPYIPVGREAFLKALIHTHKLKRDVNTKQLDIYTRQLAALQPTERIEQACLLNDKSTGWLKEIVAVGTGTCAPIVRVNPALFDPKLPRTTPQLVVVNQFRGTEESGYLNKSIDYWTTMKAITETDWQKIQRLLDKE